MFPVIPVVTGARQYAVRSKSHPGQRQIVDLSKASCTCVFARFNRGTERLCEHQKLAVEFEAEQREVQSLMPLVTERLKREAA